jgi:Ca2+-binding EF-hand superfamily protein
MAEYVPEDPAIARMKRLQTEMVHRAHEREEVKRNFKSLNFAGSLMQAKTSVYHTDLNYAKEVQRCEDLEKRLRKLAQKRARRRKWLEEKSNRDVVIAHIGSLCVVPPKPKPKKNTNQLKQKFSQQGKGALKISSFLAHLLRTPYNQHGAMEMDELFGYFDTSGDNLIDCDEFHEGLLKLWTEDDFPWTKIEVERQFSLYDDDHSGTISLPELVHTLKHSILDGDLKKRGSLRTMHHKNAANDDLLQTIAKQAFKHESLKMPRSNGGETVAWMSPIQRRNAEKVRIVVLIRRLVLACLYLRDVFRFWCAGIRKEDGKTDEAQGEKRED